MMFSQTFLMKFWQKFTIIITKKEQLVCNSV